jgi:pilus assembly protein TadC
MIRGLLAEAPRVRMGRPAPIGARPRRDPDRLAKRHVAAGSLAGALAIWLLVGGWVGVGAALVVGAVLAGHLRRAESGSGRRTRLGVAADVPFAADLLAAVLRSGASIEHGLRTVGIAVGGVLGRRMVRVADGLRLGLAPDDAWKPLRAAPETARLAYAVAGSPDSGAAVAAALERLAEMLRADAVARVESTAQRLSVLMVLPLGLCFLPAFILAGVVPVIAAVLSGVLR